MLENDLLIVKTYFITIQVVILITMFAKMAFNLNY